MKKVSITFLVLALVVGFGISTSCAGIYVSGNLGAVFLYDSDISDGIDTGEFTFDTGFELIGALGLTLDYGNRVEIELGYRANDLDTVTIDGLGTADIDGDFTTYSLMGNVYCDSPDTGSGITYFIGGGIGFAQIEADIDLAGSAHDTVFAYQLALGGSYAVSENLNIDLQYRFFGTTDPQFGDTKAKYITHNLMIGLRHAF